MRKYSRQYPVPTYVVEFLLGLEAYASDLNPVAVLINKAMIEIPPKFAGMPPVNPKVRSKKQLIERQWA